MGKIRLVLTQQNPYGECALTLVQVAAQAVCRILPRSTSGGDDHLKLMKLLGFEQKEGWFDLTLVSMIQQG